MLTRRAKWIAIEWRLNAGVCRGSVQGDVAAPLAAACSDCCVTNDVVILAALSLSVCLIGQVLSQASVLPAAAVAHCIRPATQPGGLILRFDSTTCMCACLARL